MTTPAPRHAGRLSVAFLWHQHQPLYRIGFGGEPRGAYLLPWVRLHAVRDYYSMAALVAEFPEVHVTINLVPSLVLQLEDYTEHGATDQWMEISLKPTRRLTALEKDFVVARFFDAHWKNEIQIHPRYAELLEARRSGARFSAEDITDLKAWFNLAWFPPEARQGTIELPNGERASVAGLVEKGSRFGEEDVALVIAEQMKIMRNVVPIHRALMERGQLEISVTPFYHPILPLIADTDLAMIDAPDATLPSRFRWPEDARAHVEKAAAFYRERFGRPPSGMWPSEGSVGEHIVGAVADAGYRWMATDRGVLERSGSDGYETEDPEVLLKPYRAGGPGHDLSVFFRHTRLSDDIGFTMQGYADYDRAASDFVGWIKRGFAARVARPGERVLSIILDGENAWGSYRNCGRAFLRGLYRRLSDDSDLVTSTFSEFIDGNPARGILAHPLGGQEAVHPLFCASWIDERDSPHGNDLNIWIGSPEENRAWELLGATRKHLADSGATPDTNPEAYESMYAAEGSDWFWWFGDDFALAPGSEWTFDWLFRERLKDVYRYLGDKPPSVLDRPVVRQHVVWTEDRPVRAIEPGQILRIMSPAPGSVRSSTNRWKTFDERELAPSGDAMARVVGYAASLGPFDEATWGVEFILRRGGVDSGPGSYTVLVRKKAPPPAGRRSRRRG